MKTLILLLAFWLQSFAAASQFTVEWDDENLVGTVTWTVYTQRPGGLFERQITGLLVKEFTFVDHAAGPLSIHVTAVSLEGIESFPSEAINLTIPSAPGNLRTRVRVALQSSADMQTWTTIAKYDVPEADRAFYRIAFSD